MAKYKKILKNYCLMFIPYTWESKKSATPAHPSKPLEEIFAP
jgi:hypothetical protein